MIPTDKLNSPNLGNDYTSPWYVFPDGNITNYGYIEAYSYGIYSPNWDGGIIYGYSCMVRRNGETYNSVVEEDFHGKFRSPDTFIIVDYSACFVRLNGDVVNRNYVYDSYGIFPSAFHGSNWSIGAVCLFYQHQ